MSFHFFGCPYRNVAPPDPAQHLRNVAAAFSILRPKPAPCALIRIGGITQGAYLVPDDLSGISACYSPGVNNIKYFEDELANTFAIGSHLCDFSSEERLFQTPLIPKLQTFERLWLDVAGRPDSISLDNWVKHHSPSDANDLLLQMDIEGAEYRNILATPPATLSRFRIAVFELHGLLQAFQNPGIMADVLLPFLNRIDEFFLCIHMHPNNCGVEFMVPGIGANMTSALEITFLRRDRFIQGEDRNIFPVMLPHPRDIPAIVLKNEPATPDEKWFDGERPVPAKIRAIEDELRYVREQVLGCMSDAIEATIDMVMKAATLAARTGDGDAGSLAVALPGLEEVASGKTFALSSGMPRAGRIERTERPYFFVTDFGVNGSITIDLACQRTIRRVSITNRRDGCYDRARLLFLILRSEDDMNPETVVRVEPPQAFIGGGSADAVVDLPSVRARYIVITSPLYTMLHLSNISVLAEAEPATC